MALSEREKLTLSQNNTSILSATDTNELTINEDSGNDNCDSEDFEEAYNYLFSDGTESGVEFEGFSSEDDEGSTDDDLTSSDDEEIIINQQPKNRKKQTTDSPDGWGMKLWKKGDTKLQPLPKFTAEPGFNFIIPDDANELYFFKLFFTDELLESVTLETNKYASEYLLKEHSNFKKWPENGISEDEMTLFITLTFYFGIVKKDLLRHYWSVDSVMSTPFPRSIMSRQEIFNIMSFLHCCDSSDYPGRGQPGYDPRKKIGKVFTILQERFWIPQQTLQHHIIDEGTIPFKGNIHFKVFNPIKPDKYGIKTYKVCDSTNSYCLVFDLYVGQM